MPRRENIGHRRRPVAVGRRTLLVYCGAVGTEPDYFDGFRERHRQGNITIAIRKQGVDPVRLVRAAAGYRDRRSGRFDEVWCVVDTDQYDIDAAAVEARRRGVSLAVSNPCFELWLLLHYVDCRAFCHDCREVERRLLKHLPTYDKTQLNFADFATGIADAVKRAKGLEPSGTKYQQNPSTNVWQLVEQVVDPDGLGAGYDG